MGHLIGPSGIGKAQLTHIIEDIMRYFCAGLAQRYRGGPWPMPPPALVVTELQYYDTASEKVRIFASYY